MVGTEIGIAFIESMSALYSLASQTFVFLNPIFQLVKIYPKKRVDATIPLKKAKSRKQPKHLVRED